MMADTQPEKHEEVRHEVHEVVVHGATETRPKESGQTVEVWKAIALALFGMMATGLAAWITFGSDRVSRNEMERAIENSGPYVRDRQLLMDSITTTKARNEAVSAQIQTLLVEQAKATAKLDALTTEINGLRTELRKAQAKNAQPPDPE